MNCRILKNENTVKIGANLSDEGAKALKARFQAQMASQCGGEWCVDVYRAKGRWLARAYPRGEDARGRQPGTKQRKRRRSSPGGSTASGTGGANPSGMSK